MSAAPRLLLENIKVNAQSASADKKNFKYRENNISFLVAAPSFIDEKEVALILLVNFFFILTYFPSWSQKTIKTEAPCNDNVLYRAQVKGNNKEDGCRSGDDAEDLSRANRRRRGMAL